MTFTDHVWQDLQPIRTAIDAHPFLQGLEDGRPPRSIFVHYLAQDAAYLGALLARSRCGSLTNP